MAKHFQAQYPSYCHFCRTGVKKGEMVVKIRNISDTRRKKWFLTRLAPHRENWIHKRCYQAGLILYKSELEQKLKATQTPVDTRKYQIVLTNFNGNFNAKVDLIHLIRTRHHALYNTYPSLSAIGDMFNRPGALLFTGLEKSDVESITAALRSKGAEVETRLSQN